MFKRTLTKIDGRTLELYSRRPIPDGLCAPSPVESRTPPNPYLRWHPLRGEWVAYAAYRQNRTFLPPPEYNPLAPRTDPAHPTELPAGDYDAAVFENLFPTFSTSVGEPPLLNVLTAPATGVCEVVVFTQDPSQSLGSLPLEHLELIVEVWSDRYVELGRLREVMYVMPFENRGVEVGVTLHHPHGQIYAYPFVPPIPARELALQLEYHTLNGRGLFQDLIDREIHDGRRMLYATDNAVAFVPACARHSYEVWVAPKRAVPSLPELEPAERRAFACAMRTVLQKFDRLWSRPFPYVMVLHQAPTDGNRHPEAHLHAEFYPAYRMRDRLKYLAAAEALRRDDPVTLGQLFLASHASMRDDFEISTPEIDCLVGIAAGDANVFGARMTGGGFGGAVIILCAEGFAPSVTDRTVAEYFAATACTASTLVP
jgi:UDPglucose--hexose-1-phosphate uridylyltransferase